MKKSTKNLVSTKTENATGNGCSLTWMDIGITNAQFAVEEQKTMTAVRPVLTTAPTAVQRWMVTGMAELIDRNAFRDFWNKNYRHQYANDTFMFAIANFPTTDAVPVVRCKDCKYYGSVQEPCHGRTQRFCRLHKGLVVVNTDTYCSYGERKDDD